MTFKEWGEEIKQCWKIDPMRVNLISPVLADWRAEREKLIDVIASLMDGLDDYWVCTPGGDRAVLKARAVLAEVKGEK